MPAEYTRRAPDFEPTSEEPLLADLLTGDTEVDVETVADDSEIDNASTKHTDEDA